MKSTDSLSTTEILQAFNTMKPRGLAYFIVCYALESSKVLYFIVNNNLEKRVIESLLNKIREIIKEHSFPSFNILTCEEYYRSWRNLSGEKLIFLEDKNLVSPCMDFLEKRLKKVTSDLRVSALFSSTDPIILMAETLRKDILTLIKKFKRIPC